MIDTSVCQTGGCKGSAPRDRTTPLSALPNAVRRGTSSLLAIGPSDSVTLTSCGLEEPKQTVGLVDAPAIELDAVSEV